MAADHPRSGEDNDHRYWLAFSRVPRLGVQRMRLLLEATGSLATAWHASEADLHRYGLDSGAINRLLQARASLDLDAEMEKVRRTKAKLVCLTDSHYPSLLRPLPDAPPLLYYYGDLLPTDERALAVVGTRKATRYGQDAAFALAKELAAQGVTIVSGLAPGIDTAAHQGALAAAANGDGTGGRTIAVLGSGIDNIYPRENLDLARRIVRHGAIVTEFPVGMPPEKRNFPRRNRIISGLSLGVLVVEAPEGSGALITAGIAADQGRDVFAVPSSIFNRTGSGTNRLIQDGARLVMDAGDILSELNLASEHHAVRETMVKVVPDNPLEAEVLSHLSSDPLHIDELVRRTGMPVATMSATLTILELKGLAQMVGAMQYNLTY